jgi:hypothetical protein
MVDGTQQTFANSCDKSAAERTGPRAVELHRFSLGSLQGFFHLPRTIKQQYYQFEGESQ